MKMRLFLGIIFVASHSALGMEKAPDVPSAPVSLTSSCIALEGACRQSLPSYTPEALPKTETSGLNVAYSVQSLVDTSCKFTAVAWQKIQQLFTNAATVAQPEEIELKELPQTPPAEPIVDDDLKDFEDEHGVLAGPGMLMKTRQLYQQGVIDLATSVQEDGIAMTVSTK